MDEAVIMSISSEWQTTCEREGPAVALSLLCTELARRTPAESARFLAAHALALSPHHADALALLEQTTPADEQLALCLHYERFLLSAPQHGWARAIRDRLTSLLFEHDLHYSALEHVDQALSELSDAGPSDHAIELARTPFTARSEPELVRALEELEFDLLAHEELMIADAAE